MTVGGRPVLPVLSTLADVTHTQTHTHTQRRRRRDFRDFHGSPCCRDTKVVGTPMKEGRKKGKREEEEKKNEMRKRKKERRERE